jgi:hypothetical protein
MKKIVLLVLGLLFLSGWASAYLVDIDAPDSLTVGKPLIVTGTTTFGVGTPIDVVLYYQLTTTTEIQRKIVYVQSDKTFKAVFDTTGFKKGTYKVEVPANGLGDSVTMRLIQLVDREDDIYLASPVNQSFNGKIYLAGDIKGDENAGVQIEVMDSEGLVVFGPQYVNTNNAGNFAADIPVSRPGNYDISFTDARGFIGTRTISVIGQSSFSTSLPATQTTSTPVVSAHARASRDSPAYFVVKTVTGPVTLYTSTSLDWVIEYIDDKGVLHTTNDQGTQNPERVEFTGKGKTIFVKIYPYKYSVESDVFLYGEGVNSISVSPAVPAPFAANEPQAETPTPSSPLLPSVGIVAVCLAIAFVGIRKIQKIHK